MKKNKVSRQLLDNLIEKRINNCELINQIDSEIYHSYSAQ